MQIVNLRHPGYPDESNIIFTTQAPDDPNGGIHAETLRLAGCIIAGNRWDGYLSVTQDHPRPAVPDHDGVLRRKDYYFHLPSVAESSVADEVIDRRKHSEAGPWPVVARFADWEWQQKGCLRSGDWLRKQLTSRRALPEPMERRSSLTTFAGYAGKKKM